MTMLDMLKSLNPAAHRVWVAGLAGKRLAEAHHRMYVTVVRGKFLIVWNNGMFREIFEWDPAAGKWHGDRNAKYVKDRRVPQWLQKAAEYLAAQRVLEINEQGSKP